ncbi:MAG: hypothetical protein H6828_15805 [Planctomycetes bacterium]|nr:hypothetical protein [Planctomycetota bacterium]
MLLRRQRTAPPRPSGGARGGLNLALPAALFPSAALALAAAGACPPVKACALAELCAPAGAGAAQRADRHDPQAPASCAPALALGYARGERASRSTTRSSRPRRLEAVIADMVREVDELRALRRELRVELRATSTRAEFAASSGTSADRRRRELSGSPRARP